MGEREPSRIGGTHDALATTLLDVDDLAAVLADVGLDAFLDELIDGLAQAMASFDPRRTTYRTRDGFSYHHPEMGLVEWMPVHEAGRMVAVKTVAYHPENPVQRDLPSVLATTALYDTVTGNLSTVCEATLLTALRTGAASAVVTDRAARPGPVTLGVVGCGAQAVTQIHAISRVRPLHRIIAADIDPTVAGSLGDRLPDVGAEVEVVPLDEFDEAVAEMDVICTCTSVPIGEGPVVRLERARPWLHVNAVGADFPGKTELPVEYLQTAVVIADEIEQCLAEGESQQLDRGEIELDLVALLHDPGSSDLGATTTAFDSTGWSYEDLIAAELFAAHARRLGRGTRVALQRVPDDPYDPYAPLRSSSAAVWRPAEEAAAS